MVLPESLIDTFNRVQARHHREPSYVIQHAWQFIRERTF